MPTCRRKRVLLTEPSPALLDALKHDPNREVFYLEDTGEIFDNYECAYCPLRPAVVHTHVTSTTPQGLRRSDVLLPNEAVPV